MSDELTAEDVLEIRSVLARYCQHCDDGDFADFAALFTADAEFAVMGMTHSGGAAIGEFMAEAQPPEKRGKHLISEPWIRPGAHPGSAVVNTDYSFAAKKDGAYSLTSAGRYVDRFERVDGEWKIARREIVFLE